MDKQKITAIQTIFSSRLDNLSHFLDIAENHFAEDVAKLMHRRIIADMLPFGTQIVFTCNQPRNFALWCANQPADNLPARDIAVAEARSYIASTQALLADIQAGDAKLLESTRVELGQDFYLELTGQSYVDDFLMPNFYFHLTTAYDIIRMAGAPIGKRDFMMHLMPLLQKTSAASS